MAKNQQHKGPRRVFLHVGLPHAADLSATLAAHEDALLEQGLRYPDGGADMLAAALDVTSEDDAWGLSPDEVRGAFTRLATRRPGRKLDLLISHERLAEASAEQTSYALSMLANAEVHLVVVVRDPVRQALAQWQTGLEETFDGPQDPAEVVDRWGAELPPERVHVVVAPRGDDLATLWRRFGEALGRDVSALAPVDTGRSDRLGVTEVALLRRVVTALRGRVALSSYDAVVLRGYAGAILAHRGGKRAAAPTRTHDDLTALAQRWVKEIDAARWAVHGDLADLVPQALPSRGQHPDDVPEVAVLEAAVESSADLLVELAGQRARIADLEAEVDALRRKRKKLKQRLRRLED